MLAGDFNIVRYPLNKHYLAKVFGLNPKFADKLHLIEEEYANLVETLQDGGVIDVVNCWDRDNREAGRMCITIGETREDMAENGKRVPLDTHMTA